MHSRTILANIFTNSIHFLLHNPNKHSINPCSSASCSSIDGLQTTDPKNTRDCPPGLACVLTMSLGCHCYWVDINRDGIRVQYNNCVWTKRCQLQKNISYERIAKCANNAISERSPAGMLLPLLDSLLVVGGWRHVSGEFEPWSRISSINTLHKSRVYLTEERRLVRSFPEWRKFRSSSSY